ncbi:MAG: alpha/beta hydrolase [Melioribacteraceae bacterium]|nr:alpha/beta hydrolase [Melioribacteraceae bacterium]
MYQFSKKSIKFLGTIATLYIAYSLFFFIMQRNLLFPTYYVQIPHGVSEQIPDSSKIWIENEFGITETWYLPPFNLDSDTAHPLMIIAHGNGDIIDRWVKIVPKLREIGIGILLVEYPGYGRSEGNPNQEDITNVFIKSYDLIISKPEIDKNKIILLGQSIGGGAICALAKERPSAAMILISTFTDVGIFASQYFLPKFLVKDTFDNLSVVSKYEKPILFIHAKDDKLVPYSESEILNDAALFGEIISLNGGHNMIRNWGQFWKNEVIPFLIKNRIL